MADNTNPPELGHQIPRKRVFELLVSSRYPRKQAFSGWLTSETVLFWMVDRSVDTETALC